MNPNIKYIIRAILLILVQYILSSMLPLGGYITPYIYYAFVLWLPFNIGKNWLLLVAAAYGLFIGYLTLMPGLNAAACVLIAYLRPFILSLLLPKEANQMNYQEPSITSMGFTSYSIYIIILTLVHHCFLFFLQLLSVGHFGYFFVKIILSTLISLLLLAITEIIFVRAKKTRASLN